MQRAERPQQFGRACLIALTAVLFVCLAPAAFAQARGGGRLGKDGAQAAEGGGGLGARDEEAAKGGGGMKDSTGTEAMAGGGIGDGATGDAKVGGGLAPQEERKEDEDKGPGGSLGGSLGASKTGGGMEKGPETSPLRYLATWIPAIGAVILIATAWYLRYVKGKRV